MHALPHCKPGIICLAHVPTYQVNNLQVRGDIARERWGHSSFMWGRQLVLGLGSDEGQESNTVNMLNMDTLTWDSWDGNLQRVVITISKLGWHGWCVVNHVVELQVRISTSNHAVDLLA